MAPVAVRVVCFKEVLSRDAETGQAAAAHLAKSARRGGFGIVVVSTFFSATEIAS
jgi:hypothetical protein